MAEQHQSHRPLVVVLTIAILTLTFSLTTIAFIVGDQKSQLLYVFEFARHGARAPMSAGQFPVSNEMLTPMGMRQRYLLGKYNFERFKN